MTGAVDVNIVDWSAVLSRVVLVDDANRQPAVPAAEARAMLRLAPDELDRLTAAGLPGAGSGEDRRYDFRDLYNIGIYTGNGKSRPEQAMKVMMRFASRPVEELLSRRRWTIRITGSCAACRDGDATGTWQVQVPVASPAGGRGLSWRVRTRSEGPAEQQPDLLVEGTVETAGVLHRIVSPAIRAVIDEFLGQAPRWHLLTQKQWADAERFHRLGVTDCVIANLYLADRLRAIGVEARTRCGWMTGIVDVSHGWLEVRDEDGILKAVDVILPALARLLNPCSEPYLSMPLGSLINRVIPADCAADQALVVHKHGIETVDCDLLTEVRPVLDRPGA
ncbi:hypothetical protein [Micromonospora marina]|uniref:hypothetical protein n=1 Tax=Micromonospora marina TaxID=307120 RepID=UPI003D72AB5C